MKSTRGPKWATELHRSVDRDEQNGAEDRPDIPARSNPFARPGDTSRTSTRRAADLRGDLRLKRSSVRASQPTAELLDDVFALLQKFSPHQTPPCRGAILGVRHSRAKVDSGTKSGRLQRPRAMPYRSKTKLRKAVTNHSPNCLFRPPSAASPLFDNVGLLVVFFRPADLTGIRLPGNADKGGGANRAA